MKPTKDVPALVKKIRQKKGLTQEQLARDLGVTFASVNSWENGRRTPQPFLLRRLLEIEEAMA
jgi:transcriptional regulator with XRE-family HTH domain